MTPEEHIKKIRNELDTMAKEGHFAEFGPNTLHGAVEEQLGELLKSFKDKAIPSTE